MKHSALAPPLSARWRLESESNEVWSLHFHIWTRPLGQWVTGRAGQAPPTGPLDRLEDKEAEAIKKWGGSGHRTANPKTTSASAEPKGEKMKLLAFIPRHVCPSGS